MKYFTPLQFERLLKFLVEFPRSIDRSCQIPHVLTVICFCAGVLCFAILVATAPDGLITVAKGLVPLMYPA